MLPSDIQLINQIKDKQDSQAVVELVNRHTGIYINILQRYASNPAFSHRANVDDLKQENTINIYQWALSYNPDKNMKFGSYVGQMTKFMCKNIMCRNAEFQELDETKITSTESEVTEIAEVDSAIEDVKQEVLKINNPIFHKIFEMRHSNKKPMTWRSIGNAVNMTHEGARKLYNKHINFIRQHASS